MRSATWLLLMQVLGKAGVPVRPTIVVVDGKIITTYGYVDGNGCWHLGTMAQVVDNSLIFS